MMNFVVVIFRDVFKFYYRVFCLLLEKRWVVIIGFCLFLIFDFLGGWQLIFFEYYIGVKFGICNCVWLMIKVLLILVVMLYVCYFFVFFYVLRNVSFVLYYFFIVFIWNDIGIFCFFCFFSLYQMNSLYMLILGGVEIFFCVLRYVG